MARMLARILLLGLAVHALVCASSPEEDLKAALVLGIARFAEWPPSLHADAPIQIGVLGRADFVPVLERMVAGRMGVGGRRMQVKAVKNPDDAEGCQILYFSDVPTRETNATIDNLRDAPVITVRDNDRFLEAGGAVHLFVEDGKIAFEVRLDALGKGVTISAKLLKLARIVGPRGSLP
jgi:uncharacterized protein DUF4154